MRLLAKIAYGYAVTQFGLTGIQEAFVIPAILGKRDDIGMWVGCDGRRTMGTAFNLWHTRLDVSRGIILARVKLFAKADGTEYQVVVGKISESTSGLLRGLGYNGV